MSPPATHQLKTSLLAGSQPSQFQLALALAIAKAKPEGISVRGSSFLVVFTSSHVSHIMLLETAERAGSCLISSISSIAKLIRGLISCCDDQVALLGCLSPFINSLRRRVEDWLCETALEFRSLKSRSILTFSRPFSSEKRW